MLMIPLGSVVGGRDQSLEKNNPTLIDSMHPLFLEYCCNTMVIVSLKITTDNMHGSINFVCAIDVETNMEGKAWASKLCIQQ